MQEPKRRLLGGGRQAAPVDTRRLEQCEGADDVGLDEIGGTGYRPIDMALCSQMHDPVGTEAGEGLLHRPSVADVGMKEAIVGLAFDDAHGRQISRVGQRIDVQDLIAFLEDEIPHESRTDKTGASRYDHTHWSSFTEK